MLKKLLTSAAISLATAFGALGSTQAVAQGDSVACSAVQGYRVSEDYASLTRGGGRYLVYRHFMETFYGAVDKSLGKEAAPATVGDVLSLLQAAFDEASKRERAALRKIGASASILVDPASSLSDSHEVILSKDEKLSLSPRVADLLAKGGGGESTDDHEYGLIVRFDRIGASSWALSFVAAGMKGGIKMTDPAESFTQVASTTYKDVGTPVSYYIQRCPKVRFQPQP